MDSGVITSSICQRDVGILRLCKVGTRGEGGRVWGEGGRGERGRGGKGVRGEGGGGELCHRILFTKKDYKILC